MSKFKLTNTSATNPLAVGKYEIAPASYIIVDEWDMNYFEHLDQVSDDIVGTALLIEPYGEVLEEMADDSAGVKVYASEAITRGNLLYISGWNTTNNCPTVLKADADDPIKFAVMFAPEAIGINTVGQGLRAGRLVGTATKTLNTNAATIGDKVYLSATAGSSVLTTAPSATNVQEVGVVTKKSATLGEIWYDLTAPKIQSGYLAGLTSSVAELNYVDVTTAGTVQASKAVVVDANKDAAAFRNLGTETLNAGSSGVQGTVNIYPSTVDKGKIQIVTSDHADNYNILMNFAQMASSTTLTVPDPGNGGYGWFAMANSSLTGLANGIKSATKAFVVGDMTDNADTTGYVDFAANAIPANSYVLGWKLVTTTGFTGDTTAIVQIGVDGMLDKYSLVMGGSCLAAGTIASVPKTWVDGFSVAAVTPRITITGGADFTSIVAGEATATIYYIPIG